MSSGAEQKDAIFFTAGRKDPFSTLSNFHPVPIVMYERHYNSMEHYYQAMKFEISDPYWADEIACADSAPIAKALGRSRIHLVRKDWENVKLDMMEKGLRVKFSVEPARSLLLSTGTRPLYEYSSTDRFWGSTRQFKGENHLGKLIMKIRAELVAADAAAPPPAPKTKKPRITAPQ